MKRRSFLQRFGSILAALGIAEAEWFSYGNRYYQALAQSTSRKLALLVGVNKYSSRSELFGCLTDVELQKELLIHRFGFHPSDILCLTNEQASRDSTETAFVEHITQQAKPEDIVMFHFSGYGSRMKVGNLIETGENALITSDLDSHKDNPKNGKIVDYLLEDTLLWLLRSQSAQKTVAILDTSFSAPGTRLPTGLGMRVFQTPGSAEIAVEELEFQKQMKEKAIIKAPPVLLAAASNSKQLAREIPCSGFTAGLFTYILTQYLWETTPAKTVQVSLSRINARIQLLGAQQQPTLLEPQKFQQKVLFDKNYLISNSKSAQGVITDIEDNGKVVDLLLAGIAPQLLEYANSNSRFSVINENENTQLILRSRSGLTAKADVYSISENTDFHPKRGQFIRENLRVLPHSIDLVVALDHELKRIERVDATSAFAGFENISTVIAGEQPADYVFGKLPSSQAKDLPTSISIMASPNRYGLFSLGSKLIPNTVGEEGEALKLAVQRLEAKLNSLRSAKMWRLTDNETSSALKVKACLEINNSLSPRVLVQRQTGSVSVKKTKTNKDGVPRSLPADILTVPIGSRMHYRVQNQGDTPLYIMLLGLDANRDAIALYPWYQDKEVKDSRTQILLKNVVINPQESRIIPQTTVGFEWVAKGLVSWCETQLIFSTAPFSKTLQALEKNNYVGNGQEQVLKLSNPVEVTEAVLKDLHKASMNESNNDLSADSYGLDVNHWASLNFVYQVV
ncbi:MAG: caspase family protein [Cyanobacteria bacterium P01_A01_bin.45]